MSAPLMPRISDFPTSALEMLRRLGLPTAPLVTTSDLHGCFLHTANERMVVITAGSGDENMVDHALATGLGIAGDRELVLLLPRAHAQATISRAAWLDRPIRIFTHDEVRAEEVQRLPRSEVLATYNDVFEDREHDLQHFQPHVRELESWISSQEGVVAAHRRSYRCWHFRGRAVLKLERSGRTSEIVAGKNLSKPEPHERKPFSASISGQLDGDVAEQVKAAVQQAIADRRSGVDQGHQEHLLQDSLMNAARGGTLFTPVTTRELPAYRPNGNRRARGYIDLLGVDPAGTIRILETKIGVDSMLVLQGLDYYIWAEAHRPSLTDFLTAPPQAAIQIDYVVARSNSSPRYVHPWTPGQASALARDVRFQFHLVPTWREGAVSIQSLAPRELPSSEPVRATGPAPTS